MSPIDSVFFSIMLYACHESPKGPHSHPGIQMSTSIFSLLVDSKSFINFLPRRDSITPDFISLAKASQWPLLSPARLEGTILLRREPRGRKLGCLVNRNTINYGDCERKDAGISLEYCQRRTVTAPLSTEDGLDLRVPLTPTFLATDSGWQSEIKTIFQPFSRVQRVQCSGLKEPFPEAVSERKAGEHPNWVTKREVTKRQKQHVKSSGGGGWHGPQ